MKRPNLRGEPRVSTPEAAERRRAEAERLAQGRAVAARLDAVERAWHVMYRPTTYELMAVAMWDPGFPLILTDTDPHSLTMQMRAAEHQPGQARTGLDALAHQLRSGAELPESPYRSSQPLNHTDRHLDGQFRR